MWGRPIIPKYDRGRTFTAVQHNAFDRILVANDERFGTVDEPYGARDLLLSFANHSSCWRAVAFFPASTNPRHFQDRAAVL
jgi:hypothetical protein